MKKNIVLAIFLIATSAYSWSPSTYDTLGTDVTAYSANMMLRGTATNKIMLSTMVPAASPGRVTRDTYLTGLYFQIDSVCVGSFTVLAIKDTVGSGALLSANKTAAQMRAALRGKIIGDCSFTTKTYGTAASGASFSWCNVTNWNQGFSMPYGGTIWWLVFTDAAYTNAKNGVIMLTPHIEVP